MFVITVLDKLVGVQLFGNHYNYDNRRAGKVVGNIICTCKFLVVLVCEHKSYRSQVESKKGSLSLRSMTSGRTNNDAGLQVLIMLR